MDKAIISKSLLTAIAGAIRGKTGETDLMTPEEMAAAVGSIGSGDNELIKILSGEAAEISKPGITSLRKYSLSYMDNLTDISLPDLLEASRYAFGYSKFSRISSPKLETAEHGLFYACSNLLVANFPCLKSVPEAFLSECSSLSEFEAKSSEGTAGSNCMYNCKSLKKISLPKITAFGANSFYGIGTNIEYIDIGVSAFPSFSYSSTKMKTVVLRKSDSVATLSSIKIGSDSPVRSGGGHIYVPADLIESYQESTNWSTIYAENPTVFRALENFTTDGTTTGDIDEEKIATADEEEAAG